MSMWRKVLQGEDPLNALTKPTKPQKSDNQMKLKGKSEEVLFPETGQNPTEPDEPPAKQGKIHEFPDDHAVRTTSPGRHPNPVRHLMDLLEGDIERYADALRSYGPMSYGMAMDALGWGATRAGKAEQALRQAGRIRFNGAGRAVLVDEGKADA
ncbi:hypothetical protein LJR030_003137 [Rhizobium sp. LjRoot30]|uniref:hypothetical protein n=1 Tax=Rhizobium sp. LjRoot30 TaxID=3342320 RepID=UPI003ED0E80F